VVTVFEEHGDMWGLGAALINRATLSFLQGKIDRLLADYERNIQLSRQMGMALFETLCTRDLGEVYLALGQTAQAEPYIRRALQMYVLEFGELGARTVNCEVQLARCKWYAGDVPAAAELFAKVAAKQRDAEASGNSDAVLIASDKIYLDQVALALAGGSPAQYDALIARAKELSMAPQDVVELIEWKGISAVRSGRIDEGLTHLHEALAMAEQSAGLVADRIRNQIAVARAVMAPAAGPAAPIRAS
jgi:tetratricopeptide (TPR) repeat protein